MESKGLMERLYFGEIDSGLFDRFPIHVDESQVREVVEAYESILEAFSLAEIEEAKRVPDAMLRRLGEEGLFGLSIEKSYGGKGLNLWEYLEVVRELARRDLSIALVSIAHLSIGIKGIQLFGTEEQKKKYLPRAASGEMIFSYALTEPNVGSDAKHIETTARLAEDGTHYILNGRKTFITNANYAKGFTVFARLDRGEPGHLGAFIVEAAWDGVTVGKDMPKMGLDASSTAPIRFQDVRVPMENMLGRPGDGFKIAMTILNFGRLGLGAASVGTMEQATVDMVRRAKSRIQFGTPIIDFQLIQEKIAKARVHAFVSHAMNTVAAALLEENPLRNLAIETSHCKLFGTTRAWDTLNDALQVCGGAGYLKTQPYEKRVRDFRVTTIFEGTTEIHSIYPAIFAIRKMQKRVSGRSKWLAWPTFLWDNVTHGLSWKAEFNDRDLKKAAKFVKHNARLIRWCLLGASLIHGRKIQNKEYVLRRLTLLSLYTYAVYAVMVRMQKDYDRMLLSDEDRLKLKYLLTEGRKVRKECLKLWDSCWEKASGEIMEWIRASA